MMGLGNVGGLGRLGYAAANSVGWWLSEAQLDLDFANNRSFNRKTGYNATPNGLLTYTSPSPKMVYGDDGVLRYARHNLLTYSQALDNAAWTKIATTVTADQSTAPDGTTTAEKIVATNTASTVRGVYQAITAVNAQTYTYSIYLKAAEYSKATLCDVSAGRFAATFDLAAESSSSVGGAGLVSHSITSVGGGWYRCIVVWTSSATNPALYVMGYPTGTSVTTSGVTYAGDGVSGIYAWGAQASRGAVLFDYLATTSAAKYDLPIDHDPLTGEALGVLIEEQRTNLLLHSEDCTTTWTDPIGPTTSTKVNVPSPFHDGIAFQITNTLNSGFSSGGLGQVVAVASSTQHFLSFYVEDNVGLISIALENGLSAYGAGFFANVDTATGVSSGPNAAQVTTVAVNGGWHVRANVGTSKSGGGAANIEIQMTMAGLGVPKIIAAIQFEAGAFATSYIQTGSAQVTRAADQVSLATSAFNYGATEGTVLVDLKATPGITQDIFWLADGLAESLAVYANSSSQLLLWARDGGVTQAAQIMGAHLGVDKVAYAFKANDFTGSLNGAAVVSDTSGTMPTPTQLMLNPRNISGYSGNVRIKRLTYWNSRKSNAELQALSA